MEKQRKYVSLSILGGCFLAIGGGAQAKDITIGWTSYPADLTVIADAIDGANSAAKRLGVNMKYGLSAGAVAQANAIDNLLASGIDVLAIDPEDSTAVGTSVKRANEAGVPVIMWMGDTLGGGETATLIGSDEAQGGYKIAKWGFESMGGSGPVALIQGAIAHQAGALREEGFRKALKEYPNIKLVAYGEGGWARDRAAALASDMLSKAPDVKIIFSLSDDMAGGVVSSVKTSGTSAAVVGYNGSCEVLNKIWNGEIKATLYQGWRDIGTKVVETGLAIANQEKVDKKIVMPSLVIDKEMMEKVQGGEAEGVTDSLKVDVKNAIAGCKS